MFWWRASSCLSVFLCQCIVALKFSSVTHHVRLGNAYGKVAGFADFNADKTTDILFRAGNNYSVYLWSRDREQFSLHHLNLQNASRVVYTAIADLDADGQVDLLTLSLRESQVEDIGERYGGSCFTLGVYWMRPQRGKPVVDGYQMIGAQVAPPPLVLDSNGDHIPDVLGYGCDSDDATVWTSKGFIREFVASSLTTPIDFPVAHYVDMTNDNLADVVEQGFVSGVMSLAFRQKKLSCSFLTSFLPPSRPVPSPFDVGISSFAFADMDGDGSTEAIVYTCLDPDCATMHVHILAHEPASSSVNCTTSSTRPLNFTQIHTVTLPKISVSPFSVAAPPVLGDVDLDGYPDIIVPASSSLGVLLLVNRRCHTNCNGSRVTLEPQWLPIAASNLTSVAFFDLWEDGVLDILLTQMDETGSEQLLAFRHRLQDDHAFLKVLVIFPLVLSGHCYHDCKSGQEPYGSVLPGAVVRFSTTDRMGRRKRGVHTLTSGHTHHLPFVVFGLGQTPSLVEELEVGMEGGGKMASHTWRNLVPNSQVIVIPHPPGHPDKWHLELYLTPGDLVYSTAGVLAAIFLATAVVVLLLHAREKFQDTREKRMAKHKFHFNAM